jgi:hypothetical protein
MPPNSNITQQGANGLIVHPTGAYPTDWMNVQWAVDNVPSGGTVCLKPSDLQGQAQYFHFGDETTGTGSVNVQHDVLIVGESMPAQAFQFPNGKTPDAALTPDRTIVYGGRPPFRCAPENPSAPSLVVRNLYFAYASGAAVRVRKSSGLEVSGCVVYALGAAPQSPGSVGIEATGLNLPGPELYGNFIAFDNIVTRSEDLTYKPGDSGIGVQLAAMTAHIYRNKISSFAFAGIGVDANGADALIEDNEVTCCGYRSDLPQACGIGVRRNPSGTRVTIKNNRITGGSVASPPGSTLTSRNGITLLGASDVTVRQNVVNGTVSSDGILLTTFTPANQHSTRNSIEQNDLKYLMAGHAQEFFDTDCGDNRSTANDFGAVDLTGSGLAGVAVSSNNNQLTNDTFWGEFPGTSGAPPITCVRLFSGTSGNRVIALKRGTGFPAFDLSTQIQDEGAANVIPGHQRHSHA